MLKWLLIGVAALVGLVALVAVVGVLLPREHSAASSIVVGQPPDSVWPLVRDVGRLADWWPDVERVEQVEDAAGREVWRQHLRVGAAMSIVVTEDVPPTRFVTEIDAPEGAPFGGSWTYEIRAVNGGTRVTITEDGWIANPFFRLMANVVFGLHGTMDSYLEALGHRLDEDVQPVHER